jgi:hypothetical protein
MNSYILMAIVEKPGAKIPEMAGRRPCGPRGISHRHSKHALEKVTSMIVIKPLHTGLPKQPPKMRLRQIAPGSIATLEGVTCRRKVGASKDLLPPSNEEVSMTAQPSLIEATLQHHPEGHVLYELPK